MQLRLKRPDIIASIARLPAFPGVISDLLADLDDDNSSMMTLARHVERDPVVTGRILSVANRMLRQEGRTEVRDVFTAVSLIGFARIRDIVLTTCIASFTSQFRGRNYYWKHSLAVGIGAQELARRVAVNQDYALVAGLLHDIGQLWMAYFHPLEFQQARLRVEVHGEPVCQAEADLFGLDHCEVGRLVAEHWGLPAEVLGAIFFHHAPDQRAAVNKLVALTHLAELIANALDLPYREENQVAYLSPTVCEVLELDWSEDLSPLLGQIEARFRYAATLFG
ncbi:MAG: HDOD domain-containing protein [Azovibrio sp.]|nr:HDOD domain-containing protein [Azovibrio sp.]